MDKSVWEVVGVPEIFNRDSRGKMILSMCAEIFTAISKPNHPHHHEHRDYTAHSLRSILIMLSSETVSLLTDEYEWEREDGKRAFLILDEFINIKVKDLEEIVYKTTPRARRKSSRNRSAPEDWKTAYIIATVFDFEVESEEHVEEVMTAAVHQLPRP